MTWFSFFITILYLGFMIAIFINMIKIIRLIRLNVFEVEEEKKRKFEIRKRRNRVVLLTNLLIVTMFLTFFIDYIIRNP